MDRFNNDVTTNEVQVGAENQMEGFAELNELQLSLVGGGIADTVPH